MLYCNVECPHCGNEITVNNAKRTQKCCWCRRLVWVDIQRVSRKKVKCEVQPMDFPEDQDFRKQSYSRWKDEDVYGTKHGN